MMKALRKLALAASTLLMTACYTTTYWVPGKKESGKVEKTKYKCVMCSFTTADERGKHDAAGKLNKCKVAAVTIKDDAEDILMQDVTFGIVQQRSVNVHCAK